MYSLVFVAFVLKSKLFNTPSVSRTTWVLLLMLKLSIAILYNWLCHEIPTFFDSEYYLKEANIVHSALRESPWYYLQLVFFPNDYFPEPEHLCHYIDEMGLWYDKTGYTIVRINAFIRLFSGGYMSVHFLFFGFMSFLGAYYIYKFFSLATEIHEYLLLFLIYCIPGITFWTSGMHKESLVLLAIGIILYNVQQLLLSWNWARFLCVVFFVYFLLNVRFYLVLIFLPAVLAYVWNEKRPVRAFIPYLAIYGFLLISLIVYDNVVPNEQRVAYQITIYQKTFLHSIGGTSFEIDSISNSWQNILKIFPQQFINGFVYPLLEQCRLDWCRLASIESIVVCIVLILLLFKVQYRSLLNNSLALFCLFVGFSWMSIIGIIVNNAGAIVRYRSIALLFIFIGLVIAVQKITKKV